MRDHVQREAENRDISCAWFVVPMSVTAAVLFAMSFASESEPAPAPPEQYQGAPATPVPQAVESASQGIEHVQAL